MPSCGQTLQIKETDYVLSARAVGASNAHIILRHILPNGVAPTIVTAAVSSAGAIHTEASPRTSGLYFETGACANRRAVHR